MNMRLTFIIASAVALLPATMAQQYLGNIELFSDDGCTESIGRVDINDHDLRQCRLFDKKFVGLLFTPQYGIGRKKG